jgi:1-acyl-sn-glycerol-3-phosphate acyltransferase
VSADDAVPPRPVPDEVRPGDGTVALPTTTSTGPPTRGQLVFYRVVSGLLLTFARAFWRLQVTGKEHVPADGPYIVAPVHRSNVDFALALAVTRRRMRYMGKAGIWKYRVLWPLFDALGGFPVQRGQADRSALRTCRAVLAGGEPLVLFPEGTRQRGPVVQPLFDGAAYLAARTGVPIVPVGIGGSERAMPKGAKMVRPGRITLVIGPPLRAEVDESGKAPRRAVRELTDQLHAELQRLFDEAQVRAGA